MITAARDMNAICAASTMITFWLTGPPLPVIGFSCILVITHNATNTAVPVDAN